MTISHKTRKLLWVRSGNECAFMGCTQELSLAADSSGDDVVIGEEAHIVARTRNGPRGDRIPPGREIDGIANLLLLCPTHHCIIDEQPNVYTIEVLRELKEHHERKVRERLMSSTQTNQFVLPEIGSARDGLPLFGVWQSSNSALVVSMFGSEPVLTNHNSWVGSGLIFRIVRDDEAYQLGTYSEAESDVVFSVVGSVVTITEQVFDYVENQTVPFIARTCDFSREQLIVETSRLLDPPYVQPHTESQVSEKFHHWLAEGVDPELAVLNLREIGFSNPEPILNFIERLFQEAQVDGAVAECATTVKDEIKRFIRAGEAYAI